MKIFVNARFLTQPISGVQRYGIECSRQIKNLHPEVAFVAPQNILHKDIAEEFNVTLIGRNRGQLWEQTDLPSYLAGQKYPPLLNMANTAPLTYKNNYITLHDLAFYHHPEWNNRLFSAWYNFLIPRIARQCKHIFTVSETVRAEIVEHYKIPLEKISVTYNGVSQQMEAAHCSTTPPKEKIILSVGTFNIRKNHQQLINAYLGSELKNTYKLVIIGDKNRIFADTGIDERTVANSGITLLPSLSQNELIAMYQRAEIVVSLSLYEGFGIPLLEGLYFDCKIVCSDIPVYREIYGENAIFCNPTDVAEIKKALADAVQFHDIQKNNDVLWEKYSYTRSAHTIIDQIEVTAR